MNHWHRNCRACKSFILWNQYTAHACGSWITTGPQAETLKSKTGANTADRHSNRSQAACQTCLHPETPPAIYYVALMFIEWNKVIVKIKEHKTACIPSGLDFFFLFAPPARSLHPSLCCSPLYLQHVMRVKPRARDETEGGNNFLLHSSPPLPSSSYTSSSLPLYML